MVLGIRCFHQLACASLPYFISSMDSLKFPTAHFFYTFFIDSLPENSLDIYSFNLFDIHAWDLFFLMFLEHAGFELKILVDNWNIIAELNSLDSLRTHHENAKMKH